MKRLLGLLKTLQPFKYRLIAYLVIASVLALLVIVAPPVQVTITSEGMLSISTNVALATTAVDNNSTTEIIYAEGDGFDGYWAYAGAHIHNDKLKVGIAFYPGENDLSYAVQHVQVVDATSVEYLMGYQGEVDKATGEPLDWNEYNEWRDSLPLVWVTNPTFTHFIVVDPDITIAELEAEIERIFTPDVLASADAFLSVSGSEQEQRAAFSAFRELMQPPERLGNGQVLSLTYDAKGYDTDALVAATDEKFAGLSGELDGKGKILPYEGGTIDIGAAAIDREDFTSPAETEVNVGNPANASGSLTSCEIWIAIRDGVADNFVGTFSASGYVLTVRDSENIGDLPAGSKQTASGLDISVETGDYLGRYDKNNETALALDIEGGSGVLFYEGGECIDPEDSETFSDLEGELATFVFSLYGEGEEACSEDIENSPSTWFIGILDESETSETAINYFTITNNSGGAVDITIYGTDLVGTGTDWDLSDDGSYGEDIYGLYAGLDDDDDSFDVVVREDSPYNTLISSLADSGTQDWGMKLYMPSSITTKDDEKTATITLVASCS